MSLSASEYLSRYLLISQQGSSNLIGPVGSTGPTGPIGNIGSNGQNGTFGTTGNIGSSGNNGATGFQAIGNQGIAGNIGPVGLTGVIGTTDVFPLPPGITMISNAYQLFAPAYAPQLFNLKLSWTGVANTTLLPGGNAAWQDISEINLAPRTAIEFTYAGSAAAAHSNTTLGYLHVTGIVSGYPTGRKDSYTLYFI